MSWTTVDKYEQRLHVPGVGTYVARRATLSGHWLATLEGDRFRSSGPLRDVKRRVEEDVRSRVPNPNE